MTNSGHGLTGIDFVLKISERCNLACPYCYYYFQEYDNSALKPIIDRKVVYQFLSFLKQGIRETELDKINIGFHGGEPLLLKKKYFTEICEIFKDGLEGVVDYSFSVQTNGTLVDEEWAEIFKKYGIHVGLSIDGPKDFHDKQRPDHKDRGSYDDAVRGLELLKVKAREVGSPYPGALGVANLELGAKEVLGHMIGKLGINGFDLLLPRSGWEGDHVKELDKWEAYLLDALDYYLDNKMKNPTSFMRLFSQGIMTMLSDHSANIVDKNLSQRHHVISINSEGGIGLDDNVMSLDARYSNSGMSIFDTTLRDYLDSEEFQGLVDIIDTPPTECQSCEWYRACRGGDLFHRHSEANGLKNRSSFCSAIDAVFGRILEHTVSLGVPIEDIATRLETPPTVKARNLLRASEKV